MHRRTALAAIVGAASLSGCLSREGAPPSASTGSPTKKGGTATPIRHTADGIVATFQVVDGHAPTEDTASATFDGDQVTVTGTMDPSGCNRPTLAAVRYSAADGVVHLELGGESPFGPTATVECGNASFDYRSVLTVDRGQPTAIEVVHDYQGRDSRSFDIDRS